MHLRIKRHSENAERLAAYLEEHPAVEWINYPGLTSHPSHQLAKKYLKGGFGSVITFGIEGGRDAGRTLIDNVKLWSHVANVGDAKSLIIHPASTTHQQLTDEDLAKSGTTEELIRLSVGLEAFDDIVADLDQAIDKATGKSQANQKSAEEIAVQNLLQSPFDRSEGVRKKRIVTVGIADEDIAPLYKLGYEVIPAGDIDEVTTDMLTEADAIWLLEGKPAPEENAAYQGTILFTATSPEVTSEVFILSNVHPAQLALELRSSGR